MVYSQFEGELHYYMKQVDILKSKNRASKYYTLKGGDVEKFILSLLCKYLAWVI